MIFNLSANDSIAHKFLAELRHPAVQQDRLRFRTNLERLGEVMAYEISKSLLFVDKSIETPLGTASSRSLVEAPTLITILRAGIPFLQGFLNYFDDSPAGFIGAYRIEGTDQPEIRMEYAAAPPIGQKDVIVVDPMLATGGSLLSALSVILKNATPRNLHIASVIAAPEGIERVSAFLETEHDLSWSLWTGAIDQGLNDSFYIVPGLGDAGDLSFGSKMES